MYAFKEPNHDILHFLKLCIMWITGTYLPTSYQHVENFAGDRLNYTYPQIHRPYYYYYDFLLIN